MVTTLANNGVFVRSENKADQKVVPSDEQKDKNHLKIEEDEINQIEYQNSCLDPNSQFVSDDGLTYQEVYQMLVEMLNGDMTLLKDVMMLAKMMVKAGVRVAKESQLTKRKIKKLTIKLDKDEALQGTISERSKKSSIGR